MLLTCASHVRPARPLGARRRQGAFGGCRRACLWPLRAGQLFGKLFGGGDDTDSDGTGGAQPQEEGGKLVPIDGEGGLGGTETFGPLAMLAVGFVEEEFNKLRELLVELDAEMIKLIPCSPAMLDGTLGDALSSDHSQHEQLPLGTRRVVFLSGMFAMEVMEVIAFYRESGLPEPVFAAAVPKNWDRSLKELIEDVYEDHQAVRQRAQQAQQARLEAEQQRQQQQQEAGGPQ